jgi:hypothetical protein
MDESLPESGWKGNDHCKQIFWVEPSWSSQQFVQDSTIEFEKRRNVPVRYDRELLQTTLKAMKRVGEIKKRREHAFWKSRYSFYFSFTIII